MEKDTLNQVANKAKDIFFPDQSIEAYLYLGETAIKYELYSFETDFEQEIDHKGQPQREVKGGLLSLVLQQASDELINRWMFQRDIFLDGYISFSLSSFSANDPMRIIFKEARCILYEKIVGAKIGIQTKILVSANQIEINGILHQNKP
ncbi:type VI secretion system tube protein TssD [Dysgonomonas sp. 25]|uniref:type VI secretion system tube protein TssD n=1 Tax=Dysgonomonas sp. 25 TaxID=2302933 RepID=UPI0013D1F9EC|nr:type VI secretion system tube protein TssD [Dysgonomonas sp. 25]NDV67911.1 type VI secretion system needle protein Hcp [Dysgonomonas sp. 25]